MKKGKEIKDILNLKVTKMRATTANLRLNKKRSQ